MNAASPKGTAGSLGALLLVVVAVSLAGSARATDVLIADGGDCLDPGHEITDHVYAGDVLYVRNAGCPAEGGELSDACSMPGAPTVLCIEAGAEVAALRIFDSSTVRVVGGAVPVDLHVYGSGRLEVSGGVIGRSIGGVYTDGLYAHDLSRVVVSDGTIELDLFARDSSTIQITGGTFESTLWALDASTVELEGGVVRDGLLLFQSSTVQLSGGVVEDDLRVHGGATGELTGGRIEGEVVVAGDSRMVVSDGTLDWNLRARGDSAVALRGGKLAGVLFAEDDAEVVVHGESFAVDGVPVALGAIAEPSGILTATFESQQPFSAAFFQGGYQDAEPWSWRADGRVTLVDLPEPDGALLALAALGCLLAIRRRRRGTASPTAVPAAVALGLALGFPDVVQADLVAKPNVVLIVLDDLGIGDLNAYGGSANIQTPNLDRMASQGMRFDQHYSLAPNCSPARVGILTGRYPASLGFRDVLNTGDTVRGVPAEVPMLSDVLRQQGYVTAHFGKWHMGTAFDEYTPLTRFDHWVRDAGTGYFDPVIKVDDGRVETTGHRTILLTDYVIDFVTDNHERPFFANVWYHAPHAPLDPPAHWAGEYPSDSEGQYKALVSAVDEQIGRILSALNALGLEEETLVIVTSDNGSSFGSNEPFVGGKAELFEGGVRMPFLARWVGTIPPGTANATVSAHFDLFATLVDHLGVDPSGLELHGESLLDVLQHDIELPRATPLFWEYDQQFAERDGDWKLHQAEPAREPEPQLDPVLVDLSTDPTESLDLADAEAQVVESMLAQYWDWRLEVGPIAYAPEALEGGATVFGDLITVNGGRVVLAHDRRLDFNDGDFSFRARVKLDVVGVEQVVARHPGAWELAIRTDARAEVRLTAPGAGITTLLTSQSGLSTNRAYDLAFTTSGTRWGDHTRRLYLDGLVEAEVMQGATVAPSEERTLLGNDESTARPLLGTIRAAAFYSMALTAGEIGGDADSDSVVNVEDNCPRTPNGPAQGGVVGVGDQTDTDLDAAGDACDEDDDDDGLLDTVETDTGVFLSAEDTGTDPRSRDTDADTFGDADEVAGGSDPNDDASMPILGTAYVAVDAFSAGPGVKGLIDFESFPAGEILSGVSIQNAGGLGVALVLPASVEDVDGAPGATLDLVAVADAGLHPTVSGVRSLGAVDGGRSNRLAAGTEVEFGLSSPISGFGLTLVTSAEPGSELLDESMEIFVPGLGAGSLSLAEGQPVADAGGESYSAYFVGFVADRPFQTVRLRWSPAVVDGSFDFLIDDLRLVPEPAPLPLLVAGGLGLALARRRRGRRSDRRPGARLRREA